MITTSTSSAYHCDWGELGSCDIHRLRLPPGNAFFHIDGQGMNAAEHVQRLQLFDAEVLHLTNYICTYLPLLTLLWISNRALDTTDDAARSRITLYPTALIDPDALQPCNQLTELYLLGLAVHHLDPNLFAHNRQLVKLALISMNLTQISATHFSNLHRLEVLSLRNNQLASFPPPDMPPLNKLSAIFLDGNQIEHLNIQLFTIKFPRLTYLSISKNLFLCSELNRILAACEMRRIKVNMDDVECFAY